MEENDKNYYEVLEVAANSTPEEVHKGYIRAKNAYSQDSLALYSLLSADECENILDLIEEAYSIVSDPNKRKAYDNARGFNIGVDQKFRHHTGSIAPVATIDSHAINQDVSTTNKKSMTKIVAKKRFSLDYDVNDSFEKEIEAASSFDGPFLKRIREYKQVDIQRMADMTKVSKTYLRYIEDEELENMPALVYVRGFVFQYAKCLKLNPDLVATSYLHQIKIKQAAASE